MGVLQTRQRQVFPAAARRDFQNDRAIAEGGLSGHKNPSQSTAADFGKEQEITHGFAGNRKAAHAPSLQGLGTMEQDFDLLFPGRETPDHVVQVEGFFIFLP